MNRKKSTAWLHRGIMTLLAAVLAGIGSLASAAYDGPKVSTYYPSGNRMSEPATEYDTTFDLNPGTSFYVYFQTPCKVTQVKGQVYQNDAYVGDVESKYTSTGTNVVTFDRANSLNSETLSKLGIGHYKISYTYVSWLDGDTEKTYDDAANPAGYVYYNRKGVGELVSEQKLAGDTMKSWYPLDSEDGVISFTFNIPVDTRNVSAHLNYGGGDIPYGCALDVTFSDGDKTITIDLRGKLHNVDTLAPGVTFTDDDGNPVDPPTSISLEVSNLHGADGSNINTVTVNPYTGKEINLTNQLYRTYGYEDISLPNPRITEIVFFAAGNPAQTSASINGDTDMFALTVENSESLVSADVKMMAGGKTAIVANADIARDGNVWTAAIPAEIRVAGSDDLIVYVENGVYTADDGVNHRILPLDLAHGAKEVTSVAALKAYPVGTTVILRSEGELRCSFATEMGYNFIEDQTGGLQVINASGDTEVPLTTGVAIRGSLQGVLFEGGMFNVDFEQSEYTLIPTDVEKGKIVADFADLSADLENMLVSFVACDKVSIDYDGEIFTVTDGNTVVMGICELAEEGIAFSKGEAVRNLTGVYFNYGVAGDPDAQHVLLIRSDDDINRDDIEAPVVAEKVGSLAELKAVAEGEEVTLVPSDMKVNYTHENGMSFVEDESGAMIFATYDEPVGEMGDLFNGGTIKGIRYGECYFIVSEIDSEKSSTDVSKGMELSVSDAIDPVNANRLVTFKNTPDHSFISTDATHLIIGNAICVSDVFDVLGDSFEYPEVVESVTGLMVTLADISAANDDDNIIIGGALLPLAVRGASDIVKLEGVGIDFVETTGTAMADVYTLSGVKVRNAGEQLQGLSRGIYVIDGKKVVIAR